MSSYLKKSGWIRQRPFAPGFHAPVLVRLSAPRFHLEHEGARRHVVFAWPRAVDDDVEVNVSVAPREL